MHLEVVRRGSGPPILFSHGLGRTLATWQRQLDALADRFEVIAWDLPAHGASDAPETPEAYTREAQLAHMDDLLAGTSRPAVLVGHSLGGYLSLCYALTRPNAVRALVLVATGPGYRDPEGRERWNRSILRNPSAMGLNEVSAGIGLQHDDLAMRGLAETTLPTLIVVGESDERYHGAADYMERKIPGAQRATIEGGGHEVQETHAEAVNTELERFLAGIGG